MYYYDIRAHCFRKSLKCRLKRRGAAATASIRQKTTADAGTYLTCKFTSKSARLSNSFNGAICILFSKNFIQNRVPHTHAHTCTRTCYSAVTTLTTRVYPASSHIHIHNTYTDADLLTLIRRVISLENAGRLLRKPLLYYDRYYFYIFFFTVAIYI